MNNGAGMVIAICFMIVLSTIVLKFIIDYQAETVKPINQWTIHQKTVMCILNDIVSDHMYIEFLMQEKKIYNMDGTYTDAFNTALKDHYERLKSLYFDETGHINRSFHDYIVCREKPILNEHGLEHQMRDYYCKRIE